jgi:hypothetical protein
LNRSFGFFGDLLHESFNDPGWVFPECNFGFQPKATVFSGAALGNCYAVLLFLVAAILFVRKFKPACALGFHAMAIGAGFLLFCSYLRWQPWHFRLHLPYFLLASPLIGAMAGLGLKRWLIAGIASFLMLNAALAVMVNPAVPVLDAVLGTKPREQLYFSARPELQGSTVALADDIMRSGCTNVLLKIGADSWEYPLWALLKERGFTGTIDHSLVENLTAVKQQTSWAPARTVLLTTPANKAQLPAEFTLAISYDSWIACYKAAAREQRLRMVDNQGILKCNLPRPGTLTVTFEPMDFAGNTVTNGNLWTIISALETNKAQSVGAQTMKVELTPQTTISIPVEARGTSIVLRNSNPQNNLALLSKVQMVYHPAP